MQARLAPRQALASLRDPAGFFLSKLTLQGVRGNKLCVHTALLELILGTSLQLHDNSVSGPDTHCLCVEAPTRQLQRKETASGSE
jgi:hypothetical protein